MRVERGGGCLGCAQRVACGSDAGLVLDTRVFGATEGRIQAERLASVSMPGKQLLRAALVGYLLPALSVLVGAFLGAGMGGMSGDIGALFGASIGLLLGSFLVRRYDARCFGVSLDQRCDILAVRHPSQKT